MTIHIVKLSVGPASLAELEAWQKQRLAKGHRLEHRTRMMPKRVDEVLDGGSIYWVIKGRFTARQKLLALEPAVDDEGVACCKLVYDKKMILVEPRAHRPFQGWRYLKAEDAPPDLDKKATADMPAELKAALAELGLL